MVKKQSMRKVFFFLLFSFFVSLGFSQDQTCRELMQGRFYEKGTQGDDGFYLYEANYFFEFDKKGQEYIKSRIDWEDECTYVLTLIDTNIKAFDLPIGTQIRVQLSIENPDLIHYTYLPKDVLPDGYLVRDKRNKK